MKKLLLIICILILTGTSSFAAAKFGFGACVPGFSTAMGLTTLPSVRMDIDRTFAIELNAGFNNTSVANASNGEFIIGGKLKYNLLPKSQFTPHIGGQIAFMSDSNVTFQNFSRSTLLFAILVGGTAYLGKNFEISVDLIPVGYLSQNQNNQAITTFTIGTGSISAHYYL